MHTVGPFCPPAVKSSDNKQWLLPFTIFFPLISSAPNKFFFTKIKFNMEDDALPQRENARRRKRDQQTLEHTSQHAVSTPTPSGGLVDDLSASVRDGDEVIPEGARANVEPSTSALVHDLNSAGTGSCGVDGQGRHPGSHDNGHTLPVYRSAAVGNFKFECRLRYHPRILPILHGSKC